MRGLMLAMVAWGMVSGTAAGAAERLQVPQLPDWKVVASVSDRSGEATELVPPNETDQSWTRRVTVQAFRGVPLTVADFMEQVVQKTAAVCEGATAAPPSLGRVGGAEAGTRTVACGRYKGDGRGTFTEEQVQKETERCLGCGAVVVDEFLCVGCGQCTTQCKFDAITLTRRYDGEGVSLFDMKKVIVPHVIKRKAKIKLKSIRKAFRRKDASHA